MPRRLLPDLAIAAGLFALPLLLFYQVTLGGRTLLPADNLFAFEPWQSFAGQFGVTTPHNQLLSDLVLENYAWKRFIVESIERRELPLWNPHQFAGMPFLADGQHSALYPFSLLFYVLPLWRAYGWFTVSQLFLAGILAYGFLRVLRLPRAAATLGAIVYELSLFMVVSTVFPMIQAGAAWLPLLLLCSQLIIERRPLWGNRPATLPWAVLGSVGVGMQMLAGHPEVIYYSGLVTAAFAVYRLAGRALDRSAGPPVVRLKSLPRPMGMLALMASLGVGLGAVQLAPLIDLVRYNFRTGSATFEQIVGWAYPPRHLLAFLIPDVFGSPTHHRYFDLFSWQWVAVAKNALGESINTIDWGVKNYVEGGAYVGLLPWLLAAIGVIAWVQRRRFFKIPNPNSQIPTLGVGGWKLGFEASFPLPFFLGLAALSLLFAFGTPAYQLVFWLPGINQLHSPFRWVWPLSLCVAALAAYGMAAVQQAWQARYGGGGLTFLRPHSPMLSLTGALGWIAVVAGGLVLLILAVSRLFYDRGEPLVERVFLSLALVPNAFADGRMFFSYEALHVAQFALLLIASGAALWAAGRGAHVRGRAVWTFLAVGVVSLDLFLAGYGFNPTADPNILGFTPPAVEFLKRDPTLWRFTTYAPGGRKVMLANTGWLYDLYDQRGYGSIISRQYADYMRAIEPQGDLDYNQIGPIYEATSLDSPLLDLLNVKYVLSAVPIESPKYRLAYQGEVLIYENLGVLPRAFTLPASAAQYSPDPLPLIGSSYDPRQVVLLDDPSAPVTVRASPALLTPAEIQHYGSNEVIVIARVTQPSYLVLADTYFDGWKAYIVEEELPIYRADGNFRAVYLDQPGSWTVRFRYSPFPVKFGAFASALSFLTLAFISGVWLWRRLYREVDGASQARRVLKNSLAPTALNLFNRGIDLVFAAFYLRLLGPGDAGEYAYAIVIVGWFEIWINFGLNTFLTREVARDRDHANRYLSNTTLLRLGLGLATLPILIGGLLLLQGTLGLRGDTFLAIVLLAVGMAPASISTGLTALFYAYEQAEYPAAIATGATLLKVTFGALALLLGTGYVGLAGVSILTNLATMLILGALAWRLFFRPRFELDWGLQRTMARESFPLMLNHLLATLFFKIDVPLLHTIRGEREVGWYTTAYKFIDAFNIIPSFFTLALFPLMSRQALEDRHGLRRNYTLSVKLLVGLALPLALVTTALSRILVGLLAGGEFLPEGALALSLIVWSIPIGWINSLTNYLLIALDQQRNLTRAFFLALIFNMVANLIFLPRYGFPAAAIITIFSELFEGLAFYWFLRQALGPVPWGRLLWKLGAAGGAMAVVTGALWAVHSALAVLAGLVVYAAGVWALRVFGPQERETLLSTLPERMRSRL